MQMNSFEIGLGKVIPFQHRLAKPLKMSDRLAHSFQYSKAPVTKMIAALAQFITL